MTEETGLFWERLEGETDTAYNAFCTYRDLGITRSLRRAAATFYGDQGEAEGRPEGTSGQVARFKEWSRRWMWVARVEAFDAEEARERSLRMRERRIKTAETHWSVGQLALQRAAQRLQQMGLDEEIPLKALPPLTRAALELQRSALGEPGLVVDVRGTRPVPEEEDNAWLDALSLEDKEELARIAGYIQDEDLGLSYLEDDGDDPAHEMPL